MLFESGFGVLTDPNVDPPIRNVGDPVYLYAVIIVLKWSKGWFGACLLLVLIKFCWAERQDVCGGVVLEFRSCL
jgi:hypothetical protein